MRRDGGRVSNRLYVHAQYIHIVHVGAMATYKLVYIDGRGRAELVRFILAQADVKYEDSRIPMSGWSEFRPSMLCT